ncbi:MAG: hypothetical protein AMXMBFR52_15610 [Burkholderiales bacterium]
MRELVEIRNPNPSLEVVVMPRVIRKRMAKAEIARLAVRKHLLENRSLAAALSSDYEKMRAISYAYECFVILEAVEE